MNYLIWSNRKRQWWGPNHGGYTSRVHAAGLYSQAEASKIVFGTLPGANIPVDTELVDNHLINASTDEILEKLKQWSSL